MKTSIVWLCIRLLPLALLGATAPAAAQVPENCPHLCNQTYALCIAASCDPETGECGQCNATDGSCGYCYVFEGESCSFNAPCDQVAPSYSNERSEGAPRELGVRILPSRGNHDG